MLTPSKATEPSSEMVGHADLNRRWFRNRSRSGRRGERGVRRKRWGGRADAAVAAGVPRGLLCRAMRGLGVAVRRRDGAGLRAVSGRLSLLGGGRGLVGRRRGRGRGGHAGGRCRWWRTADVALRAVGPVWAEFNQPEPAELAFYRGFVE